MQDRVGEEEKKVWRKSKFRYIPLLLREVTIRKERRTEKNEDTARSRRTSRGGKKKGSDMLAAGNLRHPVLGGGGIILSGGREAGKETKGCLHSGKGMRSKRSASLRWGGFFCARGKNDIKRVLEKKSNRYP